MELLSYIIVAAAAFVAGMFYSRATARTKMIYLWNKQAEAQYELMKGMKEGSIPIFTGDEHDEDCDGCEECEEELWSWTDPSDKDGFHEPN